MTLNKFEDSSRSNLQTSNILTNLTRPSTTKSQIREIRFREKQYKTLLNTPNTSSYTSLRPQDKVIKAKNKIF